jgi:glycosyltransferase involved in cell wall biosynthesis
MSAGPALVSIVIPAYNCARTVAGTIESCLAQTWSNFEVVVVNDGSTDDTRAELARFEPRIRVVDQENGGLAAARNAGIAAARGEFIALMDADDLMLPERITVQVAALTADTRCVLVSSDFAAFDDVHGDIASSHIASYYQAWARQGGACAIYPEVLEVGASLPVIRSGEVLANLVWGNFVHPPTTLIRARALASAGRFDVCLRYSCDYDVFCRLAALGRFAYVDAALLRYRLSASQMSSTVRLGWLPLETMQVLERIAAAHPELYESARRLFDLRAAESLVDAAGQIGSFDRHKALTLLWQGIRIKLVPDMVMRSMLHILLPRAFVVAVKSVRDRLRDRTIGRTIGT